MFLRKYTVGWLSMWLICQGCSTTSSSGPGVWSHPPSAFQQGNEYAKDGLLKEALNSYQDALKEEGSKPLILRNLGVIYVKLADFKQAVYYLKQATKLLPQDPDSHLYLAEALRGSDQHADGIYYYQRTLELNPKHGKALKGLAWSYYKIRLYQEALKLSKKAFSLFPKDEQLPLIQARIMVKLHEHDQALHLLQQVLVKAPSQQMPFFESIRGDVYLDQQQWDKAAYHYKAALKEQPMLAGALYGLGRCAIQQGQTGAAVGYLEKSLRIKPNLYEAYWHLAKLYESTDPTKAVRLYRLFSKYSADDPDFVTEVYTAKKRVAALLKADA